MKQYELMTITNVSLGDTGVQDLSNKIKDLISAGKGKVLDSDSWGKRKFAYELNKQDEGYYEVIKFEIDPKEIIKFKRELNLMDGLVRYLVTLQD